MTVEALIAIASGLTIVAILLRRPEWWRGLLGGLRTAPVELAILLLAIGGAIAFLAGNRLDIGLVLSALIVAALFAGRHAVEDYVLGIFVRVGRKIRVGDSVVIEGHEGTVAEIGRLNVHLDDARGRLIVPHSTLARAIVHRRSQRVGPLPHRFEVEWDSERSHPEIASVVRRTALLSPWAVSGRDPEIEPIGPRRVAVTVFTVKNAHGYEVERAIRDALDGAPPSAVEPVELPDE